MLLVEVEEARGNQVVREDLSSAVSSSSEVQGSRQVAFRSVQELQQQNQNLLAQIRDLEEQRERDQNQAKTARYWPCDLGSGIWTTGINAHILSWRRSVRTFTYIALLFFSDAMKISKKTVSALSDKQSWNRV